MIKAVFIDFYGTIVHEDGAVISKITQEISENGNESDKSKIGSFWWNEFQNMFINSYNDTFKTQRELEYESLVRTIKQFGSSSDAEVLSEMMFDHWRNPPIFAESKEFFKKCPLPIYIVSNIDRCDISEAVSFHGLNPNGIFTSEDARSYKPRAELFQLALSETGMNPHETVHIGDSLSSDIKGASALGINTIWLNRSGRQVPDGITAADDLLDVFKRL